MTYTFPQSMKRVAQQISKVRDLIIYFSVKVKIIDAVP